MAVDPGTNRRRQLTESKTVATAPPEEIDSSAGHSIPSYFTRESLFIALAGLLVYATLAAYLQNRGVFLGDAVSRTAAAFYVLFSRDPHLAAIGFVWSPLSTAVQIPIVFVFNVFHIDLTLAGRLTSVVAASGTLALLNTFFLGSGIKPRPRYLLVALYGLNPMVMLYAANAMSESLFIFLLVLITISFVWWARTGSIARFTHMTFAAMFALLTRYEALPLIAGVAFCLMPIMAPLARTFGVMPTVRRVEAHLIAFIFATAYSFGIWVYFNWQIMGNPLFFLQSIYGHVSIVRAMERALEAVDPAIGSIPLSLAYSFGQTLWLAPALVVVLPAAAVVVVVRRNVTLFCVLLLAMTIPLFQAYEIYAGDSPKWLRLFMYAIPFVYLLLGFVTSEVSRLLSGWRVRVAWSVTAVVLLISNAGAFFAMQQPDTAQGEWEVVTVLLNPGGPVPPSYSLTTDFEVAGYLKALRDDEALILDSSHGRRDLGGGTRTCSACHHFRP